MIRAPIRIVSFAAMALALAACTPVGALMGVGAATGLAAYQERGVEGAARDLATSSRILDHFARSDHTLVKNIGVEVYEGRALLTGQVDTEEERATAVRLAWQANGVTDVINEIHVATDGGLLDTARDTWISTSLETQLTFDEHVYAVNYAIETVGGTVYLIGIAQNDRELERVINHARGISFVKRVISHVRIKGASETAAPATASLPSGG